MNIQASNQNSLPSIENINPVSEADQNCLRAIEAVLKQHNKLDRFGVTLLHKHFPLQDDEMLVETCDPENRTLTVSTVKTNNINPDHYIETSWRLDTGEALQRCNIEVYHIAKE